MKRKTEEKRKERKKEKKERKKDGKGDVPPSLADRQCQGWYPNGAAQTQEKSTSLVHFGFLVFLKRRFGERRIGSIEGVF